MFNSRGVYVPRRLAIGPQPAYCWQDNNLTLPVSASPSVNARNRASMFARNFRRGLSRIRLVLVVEEFPQHPKNLVH